MAIDASELWKKGDYYYDEKYFGIVGCGAKIAVVNAINMLVPFADGDEWRSGRKLEEVIGGRRKGARGRRTQGRRK